MVQIIKLEPSATGSRPPIQSWSGTSIPEGYIEVPEGVDTSAIQDYMGFVDLTLDEDGALTSITGNEERYRAYLASLPPEPEPEPTMEDRVSVLETDKADRTEVQDVWDSMATAYTEGVNMV